MRCCIVKGCGTRAGNQQGKSMFRMPLNYQIWLDKLCVSKAEFLRMKAHKRFVCSDHFDEDSFEINFERELLGTSRKRTLIPNAMPLQQTCVVPVAKQKRMTRRLRGQHSKLKSLESRKKEISSGSSSTNATCVNANPEHTDTATQTTISWGPNAVIDVRSHERSDSTAVISATCGSKQRQRYRRDPHSSICGDPQWSSVCMMALTYALSEFI